MSWEIRPLSTEEDFFAYAEIQLSAYPAMSGPVEALMQRIRPMFEEDETSQLWGVYSDQQLLGCMHMLNFHLNYCGRFLRAGGIGSVAVDLTQKKQGVAKAIIQFFVEHYEQQGANITLLYPFRPDFYHQMGFGYAPKMQQYCFVPASLPRGSRRHGVEYLTEDDFGALREFSDAYAASHHGFCKRSDFELRTLLHNHASNRTLVGWKRDGQLQGYLAFGFRREANFVKNSLMIREWLWDGQPAFAAFCFFLHSQADQISQVVYNTVDDSFHNVLRDVRNGSDHILPHVYHESNTAGVGLMYRITGIRDFLTATNYRNYNGQTVELRLQVTDTFRPDNAGIYLLKFTAGELEMPEEMAGGVELGLDIADLSALLMGSVRLQSLYSLGLARVAPEQVSNLDRLFRVEQRPECITGF